MLTQLKQLAKDDDGATAVEYGLMVAAIAGIIIAIVFILGGTVNNSFSEVTSHIQAKK